jgi:Fe-S oxidoreductase
VDTWANHWSPAVGIAAVEALEDAGFEVVIPRQALCCGRPLYDYGMVDLARRMLGQVLEALRPALRAGVPIVGLEPSCVSVFRDELMNLFPDDPDARRLHDQVVMLGDFLAHQAPGWEAPRLERKALVQGHCHHKAVVGFERDAELFEKLGLDAEVLDSGCCGMAGAFGYERDHYAVSVACAERVVAPAVRTAGEDVLLVADGFSCREQIRQQTGREALHTAQVLQMARQQGPSGPAGERPERGYVKAHLAVPRRRKIRNAVVVGAALALAAGYVVARRRRQREQR